MSERRATHVILCSPIFLLLHIPFLIGLGMQRQILRPEERQKTNASESRHDDPNGTHALQERLSNFAFRRLGHGRNR